MLQSKSSTVAEKTVSQGSTDEVHTVSVNMSIFYRLWKNVTVTVSIPQLELLLEKERANKKTISATHKDFPVILPSYRKI